MSDYFKKRMEELGLSTESSSNNTKVSPYFVERVKALGLDEVSSSKSSASGSPKWTNTDYDTMTSDEILSLWNKAKKDKEDAEEKARKQEEAERENESFIDKLGRWLGGVQDTTLPAATVSPAINPPQEQSPYDIAYTTNDGKNVTWENLYNTKKKEEDFVALYSELSSSDDWEEFVNRGASIENPTVEEAEMGLHTPWGILGGKKVGNIVTYSRENPVITDVGDPRYKFMTDKEVEIYNYYLAKFGEGKADEYLKSIYDDLGIRRNNRAAESLGEYAKEHPVIASVISVGQNFLSGAEFVKDVLTGDTTGNSLAQASSAIRGSVMEETDWNIGDFDAFDFLYGTGMSMADSAASMVTLGGLGGVNLGLSAAAQSYNDAKDRGMSHGQALSTAVAAGVAEGLFETISIGQFNALKESGKSGLKNALLDYAKLAVVNASEETLTEIANSAYDILVNTDFSQYETSVRQYMNLGLSEEEARKKANGDLVSQIAEAGASGALMGIGFGGIASVGKAYTNIKNDTSVGKDIINKAETAENFDSVAALKSLAYEMAGDKKTFADKQLAKTAGKIDYTNLKARNVGKTHRLISESISKQNAADIKAALVKSGISEKVASRLADSIGSTDFAAEREKLNLADKTRVDEVILNATIDPHSSVNVRKQRLESAEEGVYSADAAPKEASPEVMKGEHKVSESGNTVYVNENGEAENVSIKKIVSTDGGIKVELDNGKTVSAKELELSSDAEAMAFEMVTRMETNPETAQVIFEAVKASDATSAEELFLGVPTAYRYGKINYEAGLDRLSIPDAIKKLAFDRGKQDAMTSPKGEKNAVAKQTKKTNTKKGETKQYSKVIFEGLDVYSEDKATPIQQASMKAIDALSKLSNFLEIHVYESKVENGKRYAIIDGKKRLAPNGYFKVGTNKIYLDINAGLRGEGKMLYTLGHEVTHTIAEWNWDDFKKLGDFLIENFGKNNVNVDELIENKKTMVANSYKLDGRAVPSDNQLYMEAYEEVVADSMVSMFADPKAYEKLANLKKQDKTLWQKFGDVIKKIVDSLKSLLGVYDGVSYESKEAEYVSKFSKDVYDKLQDLYIKAFVGAEANYQASNLVSIDTASESVSPKFSERTWSASDYVTEREATAKNIAQALGVDIKTAYKYIDDINGVARLIADDRARLDYEPNLDDKASVLKPNSEYKFSVDMSTLCAKRLLFTGTFDAIQKALPNTVFDSEDIVSLREMMQKRGYEVACGICYVESTRREIGRITQEFIDRYKVAQKTGQPISRINSSGKEVVLKSAGRTFSADKNYTPNLGELNTTDIDIVKRDHREVYDAYLAFMNARGQAKPKLLETRAEYKGEILKHFKAKSAVEARNNAGGLRLQSFSDFEVPHMIDMMQIVMDMSRVGLKSQAYTKVPAFAEVFGDSGVKINLSLIAKEDGLDSKGNLIFDDVEGINHEEAFNLRDKYSKNVGTILVGKTDAHIIAAMADPRIDYIIPFHKSSWKESLYDALGLTGYADYTDYQNEKPIDKGRKISNFDPSEYWDFTKTGDENAKTYLDKCREDGRIPKFPQFQGYPGYWKLLIDFKMYDNDGVGSPQEVVKPVFNTEASERILNAYEGGHKSFPVAKDVVEDFVKEHKEKGNSYSERESNIRYDERENFVEDKYFKSQMVKWGNLKHGTFVHVGKVGEKHPLHLVGMPTGTLRYDVSKLQKNMADHDDYLTVELLNAIPEIIAHPVAISEYSEENTVSVFGDVFVGNSPMMVGVTIAKDRAGNDITKVRTYNARKDVGKLITDDTVLYLDENKKRTQTWFHACGIQVPLGETKFGFIRSISQKTDSVKRKFSERNSYSEREANDRREKAAEEFGYTPYFYDAGYILPNGKMLNFSGEKGKHFGMRGEDHRAIERVFDDASRSDAMLRFMAEGNVRLMAESPGVDLGIDIEPTISQYNTISRFITDNKKKGYFYVDFTDVKGNVIGTLSYDGTLDNSEIIYDIKDYFKTGKVREQHNFYSERNTNAPTFYSYMGKVVDEIKIDKMGAGGVVSYLKGKGVKNEEIKWSGIEAFLEGKKSVTKAELQEFVAGSQLQIEEEMSGYNKEAYSELDALWKQHAGVSLAETFSDDFDLPLTEDNMADVFDDMKRDGYDVPSIEDQRRMLELAKKAGNEGRWSKYKLPGGSNYRELVFKLPNSTYSNNAMRGHWGQDAEGVLAHARIQDMTTSDGKSMLFIEEIQSDWHNEGHEKGYTTEEYEDAVAVYDKFVNDHEKKRLAFHKYVRSNEFHSDPDDVRTKKLAWLRSKMDTAEKKMRDAERDVNALKEKGMGDVPDAPFRTTYHEYVLKRLLRMAAEEGYDSIGWTTADIQSKRWSDDYAEGYRIEYDQDIPKFLRKYGKKWGAVVGTATINDTEVWSMDITDSMKDSVLNEGQVMYQERDPDSISNRSLLANALESAAKEGEERNILRNYKTKLRLIETEQAKLADVREKARDLRFKKGRTAEETKALNGLDFEAKQIANRISTYDRELLKIEAMKPIKDVLNREKQKAYKRAEQKGREALKKQRERESANYKKLLAEHQESRKKAIEGRHKTEMRHKIKKVVGDLDKLLRHGSKERNVKLGLQSAVASALEAVNMDTVAADERIAKLKEDLVKAKTPEKIQEISRKIDYIQSQGDRMASRLEELRRAYADIRTSQDEGITEYYKHEAGIIADKVDSVMQKVGNTPLRNMSLPQLEAVYELYKVVLTTVRGANEAFVNGKLEDLHQNVSEIMTEVSTLPTLKEERLEAGEKVGSFMWNELIPVTAFDRIGSKTFTKFFWELVRGQNTFANDVKEAKEFSSSAREKYGYSKWDLDKVHEFKLTDGRTFRVTLKHMMSIYAYSKREQALDHMRVGGFFFNDKETFRKEKGVFKVIKSNEEGYYIDDLVLGAIKSEMSKEQLQYVDEMQDYLTKMGEKGNEVSRVLWGIDIFKEKVYFPLKSSKDFVFQANQTAQETSLKNDGMTKETKPGASNPIVLEAFDDVWASHVNRMSQYHSFVIPIENLNKILNYGTWAGTASVSVSTMLKSRHGAAAIEYLTNFVRDLNGASAMHGASNPFFSLVGRFKKTAVAASLSVVVQQPTAILRAMAVMDAKYLAHMPALRHLASKWDELQKYAPIAIIKDIGGFDAGAGRQATEWLNDDTRRGIDKVMGKIDDITMSGAAWGDRVGWCTIWEAVKREVKATTDLKEGSEEFLQKAGERFTEVIVRTQVYDSTLSRSGYMRSKHESVKMLTAFMGEPTVSVNMMLDAITQAKRKTITKRQAGRVIGSVYASVVAASVAASLIYALRDDDEDEAYLEKLAEALGDKLIDDINPLNMLPVIRDINSIIDGWDVERTDVAIFKDIKDAFDGLNSENKSVWKKIEDFAGALGNALGIPAKNLLRTGREVYNLFENIFDDVKPTGVGDAFLEGVTGEEAEKAESLYKAIINGDESRIEIYRNSYKSDSAYESAVKSTFRSHYIEGDLSRSEAEKLLVQYGDLERDEAYWKLKEWDYFKQNGTDEGYSKYGSFYDAVQTGRNLKSVISEYTSHGVEAKTLASQITSHFKPLYKKMSNAERASLKGYLLNAYVQLGYNRAEKSKDINAWLKD